MKDFCYFRKLKTSLCTLILFFTSVFAFSQKSNLEIKFIKGNIEEKKQAVLQSAADKDGKLSVRALNFCLDSKSILGNDAELDSLVKESLECLLKSDFSETETLSEIFASLFNNFDSDEIRVKILECLRKFPSSANVALVNDFVSKRMQSAEPMDEVLLEAIRGLEFYGNFSSFNLLFIADILNVWPEYEEDIANSYGSLSANSESEILHIFSAVPIDKKISIIKKLNKNQKISLKIRGEVAENALSQSIKYTGENADLNAEYSAEELELLKVALNTISLTKWTRASSLVNEYFQIARVQYEKGSLSSNDFSQIIQDVACVASSETDRILAEYLDFLNKSTEQDQTPDMNVVLSVINALGDLGDKLAFDYLLYVTYLDYPEEISSAARVALAKLKW